jgi:hypothetical protein
MATYEAKITGFYGSAKMKFWRIFYSLWHEPMTKTGTILKQARLNGVKVKMKQTPDKWWHYFSLVW